MLYLTGVIIRRSLGWVPPSSLSLISTYSFQTRVSRLTKRDRVYGYMRRSVHDKQVGSEARTIERKDEANIEERVALLIVLKANLRGPVTSTV